MSSLQSGVGADFAATRAETSSLASTSSDVSSATSAAAAAAAAAARVEEFVLERHSSQRPYGFALRTFKILTIRGRCECLSYVDYVEDGGPASLAGLRQGHVLVSVNNFSVEGADHKLVEERLRSCHQRMVLRARFDNAAERVELARRALRLRRLVQEKQVALKLLAEQEAAALAAAAAAEAASAAAAAAAASVAVAGSSE